MLAQEKEEKTQFNHLRKEIGYLKEMSQQVKSPCCPFREL